MITKVCEWKEFHPNGNIWIIGEIGIIPEMWKDIYDHRTEFKGYENQNVCRLGIWKKFYDNGQLAWTLDYGDGTYSYESKEKFPSYRKDGQLIKT
ncbi:hypothetical protein HX001_14360 [Empedobacter brevis]|uniref:Uncharacterized protein n=1 Tax=Empedobacter brevis TaxID=247 RepID=A0AAJ1V8R5_9FLAO|nr:hypothetical protein [Empedobacter brevis]MDM1073669.1 hypothetical protein [Empedobacter brevis]